MDCGSTGYIIYMGRWVGGLQVGMLRRTDGSMVVIWVNLFQIELMVEIYSKSLVRAIGKVLLVKFRPIKTHKVDDKWPLFVNKQLLRWSASITLDNNNDVLTEFQPFFSINTLLHTSVGLNYCISIVFFQF